MTLVFFFLLAGSFISLFRWVNKVNFLMKYSQFFEIFRSIKIRPSYEARCKEYHHQKLAEESRNFCHTPAYLVALLHLNNTKDVKEFMAYI